MSQETKQKGCAVGLLELTFVLLDIPLKGFVLSQLWVWFAMPLGLPGLSPAAVYGLAVLVKMMTFQYPADVATLEREPWLQVVLSFLRSIGSTLLFWGFGAATKAWWL